ncbi:MAG: hypothetical protein H7235_02795 [Bdellovibrionaceae bacterium]|nr:hypothetical protein [Pseudobdellovibrionaceae bacterium]
MQFLSNLRTRLRKNLLKSNAGQGATEYILLLVVIVGLVVAFGPKIKDAVRTKADKLGGEITNFTGDEVK